MKYVVWGVAALIVAAILAFAGSYYFADHYKFDFKDPQTAAKLRDNFNKTCLGNYKQRMTKAGVTPSEDQLAKLDEVCSCARDGVIEALSRHGEMSAMELAETMGSDAEINSITKACSDKSGLAMPQ